MKTTLWSAKGTARTATGHGVKGFLQPTKISFLRFLEEIKTYAHKFNMSSFFRIRPFHRYMIHYCRLSSVFIIGLPIMVVGHWAPYSTHCPRFWVVNCFTRPIQGQEPLIEILCNLCESLKKKYDWNIV